MKTTNPIHQTYLNPFIIQNMDAVALRGWKLWGFLNFSQILGMLLAIANVAKSIQICPKTISSRNYEIPPKIEILVSFKKKKTSMYRGGHQSMCTPFGFSVQEFSICFFQCQKTAFVCEFQHTPLCKMMFFSRFHMSRGYEILFICT
jgi:hypothetical protein